MISVRIEALDLLETLGIDDFRIDYDEGVIYLSANEFLRIAEYFSKSPLSKEFEEGGWRWVCCERDKTKRCPVAEWGDLE